MGRARGPGPRRAAVWADDGRGRGMDEPAISFRRLRDAFRIFPLALLGRHFIWGSIVAGVDVARRAFHPRLPLRPGFVTYTCRVPAGTTRDLFLAMTSLMPGSLPTDVDERGVLLMHCLDTDQPLADQMADTEARLLRALERARGECLSSCLLPPALCSQRWLSASSGFCAVPAMRTG